MKKKKCYLYFSYLEILKTFFLYIQESKFDIIDRRTVKTSFLIEIKHTL